MKKYKIGFSTKGFIAFLIPIIPNIIWAILPPVSTSLPSNDAHTPIVAALQVISQFLMIALMIVLVNTKRKNPPINKWIGGFGFLCLIGYLLSWMIYYNFNITPILLIAMAVLPSIYFICICYVLQNNPALLAAVVFGIIHIATTVSNYL